MAASKQDSFTTQTLQILDALLTWAGFWLASEFRGPIREALSLTTQGGSDLSSIAWVLYIAVPFTPLVLERFGFYERITTRKTGTALWQLFEGLAVIGLVIAIFSIFAKLSDTPRLVLGVGGLLIYLALFARDRLTKCILRRRKKAGIGRERIVIVGSETEISEFLGDLKQGSTESWDIVSHFDLAEKDSQDLFELLKEESIGRVIFTAKSTEFAKVARAVEICELQGVEAWIAASFIRTQIARPTFDSVGSKPMLVLRSTPELSWELLMKGFIDRTVSLIVLAASLPLLIFAAIGIRITSPGAPIFFSQMRAGRYGKPFRMWKFRTMVANAEELLDKIKAEHGNQMDGPVFKLERDPRIFPFGAFLRKLSIDELPQLMNVFLGDMSLVGPRPLPLYEVKAFSDISHRRRLSVKPGITCEWQAGGRNKITKFEDWVEMDLRYIDNWSLWLDIQILLRTIPAVLFGKGAK